MTSSSAKDVDALAPYFNVQVPEGSGPFPAMLMFSGCSGFESKLMAEHYDSVQRTFTDMGFVTYRVDILKSRQNKSCDGVYSGSVSDDVGVAVDHIRSLKEVKGDSISLIGWSWGAKVTLQAISRAKAPDVHSVTAFYPNCDYLGTWITSADVLLLSGDKDTIADPVDCEPIFDASTHGAGSTFGVFPGALHLFDVEKLATPVMHKSHQMGFDAAAAKGAWGLVEKLDAIPTR